MNGELNDSKYVSLTSEQLKYYKKIERQFNFIMDSTFDLITISDKNGIIRQASKRSAELFGIPMNKIIGAHTRDLEVNGILTKSITAEVVKDRKEKSLIQDTKAGKKLMVTARPMYDENGDFVGVVSISRDITKIETLKKQLEDVEEVMEWYRNELFHSKSYEKEIIIGNSDVMKSVIKTIDNIANYDITILLTGESGVGKSMFAKMIHIMSKRRKNPFVIVNCGAIPENLFESELFGYEEGAFTGANKKGKKGLFESADNGTIFLDEISEMPLSLQVKLLHVLQEKEVYKIGSINPYKVNARVIVATNKDINDMVKVGSFREDLYYRLNVMPIHIPSLRERGNDIKIYVSKLIDKYNKVYCKNCVFEDDVNEYMINYNWPGNIRELENVIERIVVSANKDVISKEDILNIIRSPKKFDCVINEIVPIKEATNEIERQLLIKAFEKYKTTREVGRILGIDQSTVVKKMQKHSIVSNKKIR